MEEDEVEDMSDLYKPTTEFFLLHNSFRNLDVLGHSHDLQIRLSLLLQLICILAATDSGNSEEVRITKNVENPYR